MSTNTTTMQGRFTSTGSNIFIPLRAGVTWMKTFNITSMASPADGDCLSAYWQFGMPADSGIKNLYVTASTAAVEAYSTSGGFTYIDKSEAVPGVINATITAISTATAPVVTNSGTNGLVAGDIVRLFNVQDGASGFDGIDFVVGSTSLSSTTFQLQFAPQLSVAGTTGSWMKVAYDPIFYPSWRTISIIASPSTDETWVSTTVPHGYQVGQTVRFNVTSELYGSYVRLNGVQATITEIIDAGTFALALDSSTLGAFSFPTDPDAPFTPATITPVGENTAVALDLGVNILSDATINTAQLGMLLSGGAANPAGAASDVIYWQAGTVFSVDNE